MGDGFTLLELDTGGPTLPVTPDPVAAILDALRAEQSLLADEVTQALEAAATWGDAADCAAEVQRVLLSRREELERILTASGVAGALEGMRQLVNAPGGGPEVGASAAVASASGIVEPALPRVTPEAVQGTQLLPLVEAAVRHLAGTGVLPPDHLATVVSQQQSIAAQAAENAIRDTHAVVNRALVESVKTGGTLQAFRKQVREDLAVASDSFLSDNAIENRFRTGVMNAYSRGQMHLVTSNPFARELFPYASFDATHDDRVRDTHLHMEQAGLDGTNVFRVDDPVFQQFMPPIFFRCRCVWSPLTVESAAEAGVTEAQEWLRTGIAPASPARVPPLKNPPETFASAGYTLRSDGFELAHTQGNLFDESRVKRDEGGRFAEVNAAHNEGAAKLKESWAAERAKIHAEHEAGRAGLQESLKAAVAKERESGKAELAKLKKKQNKLRDKVAELKQEQGFSDRVTDALHDHVVKAHAESKAGDGRLAEILDWGTTVETLHKHNEASHTADELQVILDEYPWEPGDDPDFDADEGDVGAERTTRQAARKQVEKLLAMARKAEAKVAETADHDDKIGELEEQIDELDTARSEIVDAVNERIQGHRDDHNARHENMKEATNARHAENAERHRDLYAEHREQSEGALESAKESLREQRAAQRQARKAADRAELKPKLEAAEAKVRGELESRRKDAEATHRKEQAHTDGELANLWEIANADPAVKEYLDDAGLADKIDWNTTSYHDLRDELDSILSADPNEKPAALRGSGAAAKLLFGLWQHAKRAGAPAEDAEQEAIDAHEDADSAVEDARAEARAAHKAARQKPAEMAGDGFTLIELAWERDPNYKGAVGKWIGTGEHAGQKPRYQAKQPGLRGQGVQPGAGGASPTSGKTPTPRKPAVRYKDGPGGAWERVDSGDDKPPAPKKPGKRELAATDYQKRATNARNLLERVGKGEVDHKEGWVRNAVHDAMSRASVAQLKELAAEAGIKLPKGKADAAKVLTDHALKVAADKAGLGNAAQKPGDRMARASETLRKVMAQKPKDGDYTLKGGEFEGRKVRISGGGRKAEFLPKDQPAAEKPMTPQKQAAAKVAAAVKGDHQSAAAVKQLAALASNLPELQRESAKQLAQHGQMLGTAQKALKNAKPGSPEWQQALGAVKKLNEYLPAMQKTYEDAQRLQAEQTRKVLAVQQPSRIATNHQQSATPAVRSQIEHATNWLGAITHGVDTSIDVYGGGFGDTGRSYYAEGHVNMAAGARNAIAVHEIGHHLERDPGVQKALHAFLEHRCGDEPYQELNDVAEGGGFAKGEKGRKDSFEKVFGPRSAWYVGKTYADGGTELLSMGIQALYEDPAGLAQKDPELCQFIIGVLHGRVRG